jgi:hypothetical protein
MRDWWARPHPVIGEALLGLAAVAVLIWAGVEPHRFFRPAEMLSPRATLAAVTSGLILVAIAAHAYFTMRGRRR